MSDTPCWRSRRKSSGKAPPDRRPFRERFLDSAASSPADSESLFRVDAQDRAIARSIKAPSPVDEPPGWTSPFVESGELERAALEALERRLAALEAKGQRRAAALEVLARMAESFEASERARPAAEALRTALATIRERERVAAEPGNTGDRLCDTDRKLLRVLHRLRAFDHGSKTTRNAVANDWKERIGSADSKHFKKSVAKLKQLGLIHTAIGPKGGVWLTPKGRDLIAF
jgi:hypothetical protein